MTSNLFADRLGGSGLLSGQDRATLTAACDNVQDVPANHHLIREGDNPVSVFVMLTGWACRYKVLPDGGRQISAFMLPGDFCDTHIAVLEEMDHNVMTLTEARIAAIPRVRMEALVVSSPAITRAFWWSQLVDQGVLREWISSMGRRTSIERVAHLICGLYIRLRSIGLATDDRCELPLTQLVIADALGLTAVHVNRVLRQLRLNGAMDLHGGALVIHDPVQLARVAGFDETYLHRRLQLAA